MKVSIIIPVYNVAQFIERCLLSALSQTWQDLEIIVVDDCSPDDSIEIAQKVIASHSRGNIVKIIRHEKNGGLSVARNTGIEAAYGDYLYFLDSDDYISLNCIDLLASPIQGKTVDFSIGEYKIIGEQRRLTHLGLKDGIVYGNNQILNSFSKEEWYVMAWNKLIKKEFLIANKLYFKAGIVHEDDLWTFMIAITAQSMCIVNKETYMYVVNPSSITGKPNTRNLDCRLIIIETIYNYITSHELAKHNANVYILFEKLKAKYFDRILYFCKDEGYRKNAYNLICNKKYRKPESCHIGFRSMLRNIHYALPMELGYYYFKIFITIEYKSLLIYLRLKHLL